MDPNRELKRSLGTFDSIMMKVGIVVGSGIFITTGIVAEGIPSVPLLILAWGVGGLLTLAGALTFAELGAATPEAGGLTRPDTVSTMILTLRNLVRSTAFGSTVLLLSACSPEAPEPEVDPRIAGPLFQLQNFNETAPETFRARFETSRGAFVIEVHRAWAPLGADRFYNLVENGWYDGVRFHRVLTDFTAEWGIHDDPYVNAVWRRQTLDDDPVTQTNTRGRVTFSKSTVNSRTVQVFVNLKDNRRSLDNEGFAPFGEVIEGMDVIASLYDGYGDGPPRGEGVYQAMAIARGAEYLDAEFSELDRIERAVIVGG